MTKKIILLFSLILSFSYSYASSPVSQLTTALEVKILPLLEDFFTEASKASYSDMSDLTYRSTKDSTLKFFKNVEATIRSIKQNYIETQNELELRILESSEKIEAIGTSKKRMNKAKILLINSSVLLSQKLENTEQLLVMIIKFKNEVMPTIEGLDSHSLSFPMTGDKTKIIHNRAKQGIYFCQSFRALLKEKDLSTKADALEHDLKLNIAEINSLLNHTHTEFVQQKYSSTTFQQTIVGFIHGIAIAIPIYFMTRIIFQRAQQLHPHAE